MSYFGKIKAKLNNFSSFPKKKDFRDNGKCQKANRAKERATRNKDGGLRIDFS